MRHRFASLPWRQISTKPPVRHGPVSSWRDIFEDLKRHHLRDVRLIPASTQSVFIGNQQAKLDRKT
ncbi:hypothetical protein HispidOSU_001625, partial [Sigmodon hispidus]